MRSIREGSALVLLTLALVACSSGSSAGAGTAANSDSGTSGGAPGAGGGGSQASGGSANGSGGASTGKPGQIGGCDVFSADDEWNRDVSNAPVDPDWTTRLQTMVGNIDIHPDYGNSPPDHYGIPINVVPQGEPMVGVTFDSYPDESDPGPYPLPDPSVAKVEGGTPEVCDGDCHFLVVESGACTLFEGYACSHQTDGWHCGNGARWDLTKNSYGQRPKGWTSADAAGLPILPGLVRLPEVRAGEITHAFRFTVECTRDNFVKPATHRAVPGSCDPTDANSPPMGLRVRLSRDYDVSGLSAPAQVVARAMKKYGMIIADNGSNFYFQGEDDPGWTDTDVEPLKKIPASAFEVIAPPPLER